MKQPQAFVLIFLLCISSLFAQTKRDSIYYFKGILLPDGSLKTDSGLVVKRDNTQITGFKIIYPKGSSKVDDKIDLILSNSDTQISETEQLLAQVKVVELRDQLRYLLEREKIDKETFEKIKNSFDKDEKWDEESRLKNEPEPCKRIDIDYKEVNDFLTMVLKEKQFTAPEPPVVEYNCLSMHPEKMKSYNFAADEYVNIFFTNEDEIGRKLFVDMKYASMIDCYFSDEKLANLFSKLCTVYRKKVEYFKKNYIDALSAGPQRAMNNLLYFRIAIAAAKIGALLGETIESNTFWEYTNENFSKIMDKEVNEYTKLLATGDLKAFTYLSIYKSIKYEQARCVANMADLYDESVGDINFIAQSLFKLSMSFDGNMKEVEGSEYLNQTASAKARDIYFLCEPDSTYGVKFIPVSIQEKEFHIYDVSPAERFSFDNPKGQMAGKDFVMTYLSPETYSVPPPELIIKNICDTPDSCIIRFERIGPSMQNFSEMWTANPGGDTKLPEGLNSFFKNLFMYTELMKTANDMKTNSSSAEVDQQKMTEELKKMAEEMKEKMKDPNFNYQDYIKKMEEKVKNGMKKQTDVINSVTGFKFALPFSNGSKEPVNILLQAAVMNPDFATYIVSGTANIKLKKINPRIKQKNLFDLVNE